MIARFTQGRNSRLGGQDEVENVVVNIVGVSSGQELESLGEVERGVVVSLQKTSNENNNSSIGRRLRHDSLGGDLVRHSLESEVLWDRMGKQIRQSLGAGAKRKKFTICRFFSPWNVPLASRRWPQRPKIPLR